MGRMAEAQSTSFNQHHMNNHPVQPEQVQRKPVSPQQGQASRRSQYHNEEA